MKLVIQEVSAYWGKVISEFDSDQEKQAKAELARLRAEHPDKRYALLWRVK